MRCKDNFMCQPTINHAQIQPMKSAQPTVAVIDSQSVRTGLAQSAKGIDGGKKQLSRFFSENLKEGLNVALECVKSNFGTSEFKPIDGRWAVERTFSWLESFRRLNRNYEQFFNTAKGVAMAACAMFMLRFV